jgi:hypothetical protein
MFSLNDHSWGPTVRETRAAVESLRKEVIALDVFIETVKANPKAFK